MYMRVKWYYWDMFESTANSVACSIGYSCAQTPTTFGSVNSVVSSGTFTRYLYSGMTALGVSDPDVKTLQERLKSDGVYSGPVTGYFGPLTKTAVEAYQKKNGLSTLGVVGPSTRALLNKGI